MTYRSRVIGTYLELKFSHVPNVDARDTLKELGCKYDFHSHTWTASRNHQKVLDACDSIVEENNCVSGSQNTQLCWDCARSGYGNVSTCPWERASLPVDGWVANAKMEKKDGIETLYSYEIVSCPLFVKEERGA